VRTLPQLQVRANFINIDVFMTLQSRDMGKMALILQILADLKLNYCSHDWFRYLFYQKEGI
jgi:hypothetical protein